MLVDIVGIRQINTIEITAEGYFTITELLLDMFIILSEIHDIVHE
jgi:hypothetical protein